MAETPQSCAYCGAPLEPGARLCASCGQPVSGAFGSEPEPDRYNPPLEDVKPEPAAIPPAAPASPYSAAPSHRPTPAAPPTAPGPAAPATPAIPGTRAVRRPRWLLPALIALGIGCLVCLAVAVVLAISGLILSPTRVERVNPPLILEEATVEIERPFAAATMETQSQPATPAGSDAAQATSTEGAAPLEATTEPPTETPLAEPSVTSAPTNTPPPTQALAAGRQMDFQGISLVYSSAFASGVNAEVIPAQGGADLPYWEIYPDHAQFIFRGYPQGNNDLAPRILIYPVAAYAELNPDVQALADGLQKLLVDRPSDPGLAELPYLPYVNAGQVLQAQIRYLDFQNGAGVRYLTQFAQDVSPIHNSSLVYTFQGLTRTGSYYITATMPVSHPDLPAEFEIPGGDYDAFLANYDQYRQQTRLQLDAYPPGSFTPGLDLLDEMLQSLLVKPKKIGPGGG